MSEEKISGKQRFLNAIAGRTVDRPPVWLMRQAGRYLPEYRELKTRHSFLEMASSPELAAEVTLQPLRRFPLDAAIIFSDILFPVPSLGFRIDFRPGPVIDNPIRSPEDIDALAHGDRASFQSVASTIQVLREELKKDENERALIGFAGSPWTLACYLTDQRQYKHFHGTQVFAKRHPEHMHRFLQLLTELVTDYLLNQIRAGVDTVQLFDTWGGNLSEIDYRVWSLPYIQQIVKRVRTTHCPIALYTNGSSPLLSAINDANAHIVSVDWRTPISECLASFPKETVLQGNFDPTDLFLPPDQIDAKVRQLIESAEGRRFIVNLGHGVLPETPIAHVAAFIEAVRTCTRSRILPLECEASHSESNAFR